MERDTAEEAVLKTTTFNRKSLEPITEESLSSSTDVRTSSIKAPARDSLRSPSIKRSFNKAMKSDAARVTISTDQTSQTLLDQPVQMMSTGNVMPTVKKSSSGKILPALKLKETPAPRTSLSDSISMASTLKSSIVDLTSSDEGKPPATPATKICPTTKTECPTLLAMQERRRGSFRDSISDDVSQYSDYSNRSSIPSKKSYSSLLEKPFIFRRAESLQKAVDLETKKFQEYLTQTEKEPSFEEEETVDDGGISLFIREAPESESEDKLSESVISSISTDASTLSTFEKRKMAYLLRLQAEIDGEEEEEVGEATSRTPSEKKVVIGDVIETAWFEETEAMRLARRYLRVHRIFEFYQFLVAHLLSALPENPINFLLGLLDKCIVYRAGIGKPPILYDRKHLEALFNLMDRMRTGYIDKKQYVTGMKTLGICSYNPDPPTVGDMIHKTFFIEEAYENLVSMLNDIIRRRWIYLNTQPLPITTPPPTPQFSMPSGRSTPSSNVRKE